MKKYLTEISLGLVIFIGLSFMVFTMYNREDSTEYLPVEQPKLNSELGQRLEKDNSVPPECKASYQAWAEFVDPSNESFADFDRKKRHKYKEKIRKHKCRKYWAKKR